MLVGIIIAATAISTLVFVMLSLRKVSRPLALVEAREGVEWRLGVMAPENRKRRLCVRYEVKYNGVEDDFGLVVDYHCRTPEGEIRERAGVGHMTPPERDRFVGTSYGNSYSSVLGNCRQKATFILATLGPFPYSAELEAAGTVHVSQGTTLVRAEVYFS